MKGTIAPFEKFNKVNSISDAHTLMIDLQNSDMDEQNTRLYVMTEMVKALIISRETFSSDSALIKRASTLTKKIIEETISKKSTN